MSYTDVTNPVIVNVTKTTQFKSDNFLRRMALVSDGNSNLNQGEYKSVNADNFSSVLTADTESYIQASNFFSAAGSTKELVIIEVGKTTLAIMCNFLKTFIEGDELRCFNYILPKSFYDVKRASRNATATVTAPFTCVADFTQRMLTELQLVNFSAAQYPITVTYDKELIDYDVYAGLYTIKTDHGIVPVVFTTTQDEYTLIANTADTDTSFPVGLFETNIANDKLKFEYFTDADFKTTSDKLTVDFANKTYKAVAGSQESDFPIYVKITDTEGNAQIGSFIVNYKEDGALKSAKIDYTRKGTTLKEQFPVTATLTDQQKNQEIGKIIFNHVDSAQKTQTSAFTYTSSFFGEDLSFINMATTYSAVDKEIYFFLPIDKNEDPSISQSRPYYDGLKSVMTVQENVTKSSQSLTGNVVGITASSYFDFSISMPASSLNYKATSVTPFTYTKALKKSLIDNAITFCDELAGQAVVLNGRMRDGKPWDYYYNWAFVDYNVRDALTGLILNGQNNPNSAVRFNQDGIDKIHDKIVAKLHDMVSIGALTAFAQSYDGATGTMTNVNDIYVPEFYSFIANNPQDYENEILSGISAYLQIGRFVRQVQWNVTLG